MSEFKKGDKALLEVEVVEEHPRWADTTCGWTVKPPHGESTLAIEGDIHPHPGVSVAALLREIRLREKREGSCYIMREGGDMTKEDFAELGALICAREAANEPKLELGQRVEADGRLDGIAKLDDGYLLLQMRVAPGNFEIKGVHPDDIRTEVDDE